MAESKELFACGYIIHFSDGGPDEERVLARHASRESCERMADLLLAVSYSGNRPNPRCQFVIVTDPVIAEVSSAR